MDYLDKVFNNMEDAVVITDPFKRIVTACNPATEKIFGYKQHEIINQSPSLLHFDHEDYLNFGDTIKKELKNNDTLTLLHKFRHKSGKAILCKNTFSVIKDKSGNLQEVINILRDVSRETQALEDLAESENRFRTIFDQAAVGVAQTEIKTGRFVKINNMLSQITGYSKTELLKMSFRDISHPDELDENLDLSQQLLRGEINGYSLEKRYITKKGDSVWVHLTVSPMWKKGETPDYSVAVIKDISQEKLAKQAIYESERLFRTIFDHAPIGVGLVETATKKIINVNREYCNIFGYTKEELLAMTYSDFTYPEDQATDREIAESILKGKISEYSTEKRYIHKNGNIINAILTVSPLAEDSKQTKYNISIIQDITETKNLQDELMKSQDSRRWEFLPEALRMTLITCLPPS